MYFENNNTCNSFYDPFSTNQAEINATCDLAYSIINVSDAATAIAGVKFARENNVRLIMKNAGHDVLGRSIDRSGFPGAVDLQSKEYTIFFQDASAKYTGAAVRVGAGV